MFFQGWSGLVRVLVVGVIVYAALILFLRISGKRTLSKMNAFDLVVTVAIGSTLATVVMSKTVALAEGLLAFALLIGLQYTVASLSVRSRVWRKLVKSEPRLLMYRGEFLDEALRQERVTREEVRAAVRSHGLASLEQAHAVVLETDGTFSIVENEFDRSPSALQDLRIPQTQQ